MKKASDVVEGFSEKALIAGIGGIVGLAGAGLFFSYGGGGLKGLAIVLLIAGVAGISYAIYLMTQIRKVEHFDIICSFCKAKNMLAEPPTKDFTCSQCYRLIPIIDGRALPVQQVRCGYCNELNWYSEKTQVLLCESCNHDIPINRGDDSPVRKSVFAVESDDRLYELRLVGVGKKEEDLINALQHILALNRNQVKQMLEELPVTLLVGIPRKKAEMLAAQISVHDGVTEYQPVP